MFVEFGTNIKISQCNGGVAIALLGIIALVAIVAIVAVVALKRS